MSDPIPVGVLGCGRLGTFHARIYRDLPDARLVMVADLREDRARELGESLGVPWTIDPGRVIAEAYAVSIATPTTTHASLAMACFEEGRHVLVEKPMAFSVEEGMAMTARAEQAGVVLAVGHTERFNPAFLAIRDSVGSPRFVESHRLAPFVPRSLDVDVVLDLMIHDIDLTLCLVRDQIESIDAVGVPVLTDREDIASARIRFCGGAVANLTASRVSRERTRKIRFFSERRYISLNLMDGKADEVVLENAAAAAADGRSPGQAYDTATGPGPGAMHTARSDEIDLAAYFKARRLKLRHGSIAVPDSNPLQLELADFLRAVRGAPLEGASGRDGLRSLEAALEIHMRVQESLRRFGPDQGGIGP